MARGFRVRIPIKGYKYTLPLLRLVNPLLATQLPSNTLRYTQLPSYEQPLERQQGME